MFLKTTALLAVSTISLSTPQAEAGLLPRFKSTEVSQVILEKHNPNTKVRAQFHSKGQRKPQIIDLSPETHQEMRRYSPTPLRLQTVDLRIDLNSQTNLPVGKALKATLKAQVTFLGGNQFKVKMKPIYIGKTKFKRKKLDCSSLLYVSPHMARLVIEIKDEAGLAACKFSKTSDLDPMKIGNRDLHADNGNFFSESREKAMGDSYAREFISQNQNTVLNVGHPASIYAQSLMSKIAASSDRPDIQPRVYVVNAPILNAFALPGGSVFVFRGLLDASTNEAQVAGVLGHEWAHVTLRHGTRGMSRNIKIMIGAYAGYIALGVVGNKSKSDLFRTMTPLMQYATLLGGQFWTMYGSREQERDADKYGAQYAWRAGYAPYGIGEMFEIFAQKAPIGHSFLEEAFSSHPDHAERISTNYLYSGFFYPASPDAIVSSTAYSKAKDSLADTRQISEDEAKGIMNSFANGLKETTETNIKEKFAEIQGLKD